MWNFISVSPIHKHPVSLWKTNIGENGLFLTKDSVCIGVHVP